jgi:hypothetical protein
MPRAFPSQIVKYLGHLFRTPAGVQDIGTVQSFAGPIAGFLSLYDQLPDELIRLSADDSAALTADIGTIRFGIEQFRQGVPPNHCLGSVGLALGRAWMLIEKLEDAAPSTTHDLSFIADPALREMIALDLTSISTDLGSGEWKSATVLAGSCCEALLLYGLQATDSKTPGSIATGVAALWSGKKGPDPANLVDSSWNFSTYAAVAHKMNLISDNTKSVLDPARNYRNLIHPAKAIRDTEKCNRGTAFIGAGAVDQVISDLKRSLR